MNKIFIILGIIIIVLLLGLWSYLLVYGSPTNSGWFYDFNLSTNIEEREQASNDESGVYVGTSGVPGVPYQISTRPVAGFKPLNRESNSIIRYVEKGTGHVYEIDTTTGTEVRISGTTIAKVTDSVFSPNGSRAALISDITSGSRVSVLDLDRDGTTIELELPSNIEDVFFIDDSTLWYTKVENELKIAFGLDLEDFTTNKLWESPMTEVRVYWGKERTFLVNKPAPKLFGNTYVIDNNSSISPVGTGGYAYNALVDVDNSKVLETYLDLNTNSLRSSVLDIERGSLSSLTIVTIPEKCTFDVAGKQLWCGLESPATGIFTRTVMNDWYAGLHTFGDSLKQTPDVEVDATYLKYNFSDQTGYAVDVENMTMDDKGEVLFFTNRLNDTLWLYRLPADLVTDTKPI